MLRYFIIFPLLLSEICALAIPMELGKVVDSIPVDFDYFIDTSGKITIDDLKAKSDELGFKHGAAGLLSLGFVDSPIWLRVDVNNSQSIEELFITIMPALADYIELYNPDGKGGFEKHLMGDKVPYQKREYKYRAPTLKFSPQTGQSTIYFRVKSGGDIRYHFWIFDRNSYEKHMWDTDFVMSMMLGIFLIMIVYNFVLFLSFRTRAYAYYLGYMVAFSMGTWVSSGYASTYFYPASSGGIIGEHGLHIAVCLVMMFSCLFSRAFLNLPVYSPRLARNMSVLAGFFVLCIPLMPLIESAHLNLIVYQFLGLPMIIISGVLSLKRGYRPARFFLYAWSFFVVGAMFWIAANIGVIEFSSWVAFAPGYGTALECMLLSIALGDKMRLEQEKSQLEIEELNQALERKIEEVQDKEKARTLFFNNTSHELRTPLNGILGYLGIMTRGSAGEMSDMAKEIAAKATILADSLKYQVNTILELARSSNSKMTLEVVPFDVNRMAMEVAVIGEGLTAGMKKVSFSLEKEFPDGESQWFETEKAKVMLIIRNLMGNAFKFKDPKRDNRVLVFLSISKESLVIEVSDTGIGIPENLHQMVFEEFEQVEKGANRSYEGSGLGLSLVKKVTDILDAKLKLDSKSGVGTKITVTVPRKMSAVQAHKAQNLSHRFDLDEVQALKSISHVSSNTLRNKYAQPQIGVEAETILIVDDNPHNVEVAAALMLENGYNVETTLRGADALQIIKKKKIDLVLLDLMMPEVSGEEVLAAIRGSEDTFSLPVILLTARASEEDRLAGLRARADEYLAKPIDNDELIERVSNTLRRINDAKEAGRLAQIITSEKIVSLGTMAAGVSHELNNPLSAILGMSQNLKELVEREGVDHPMIVKTCERLIHLSMRMAKIVKSLRTYARDAPDAAFEEVLVSSILETTLSLCHAQMVEQWIELKTGVIDQRLSVECREADICKIIVNLLQNATDAVSGMQDPWVSIEVKDIGDSIEISVTDSGCGIPEALRGRVFDPFFTQKEVGEGIGIGLSTSLGIALTHNGSLAIDSGSKNTRFVLTLPKKQLQTADIDGKRAV